MAEEDKLYKMNVRSPFYVVATAEGAPSAIATDFLFSEDVDFSDQPDSNGEYTDDNLPDQPDEYVPPPTDTKTVTTGETIRVSSDIGIRTYKITDSTNKTGDFTIDYTANVPIKIEVSSTGDTTNTYSNKYYGNNFYEDAMVDAGVSASDLDQLTDGDSASGTLTFTKNNGSGTMEVKVYTVLETDDFTLTFNAPAVVPQDSPEGGPIPASYTTLPASPGDDAYDGSGRYKIEFNVLGIWFAEDFNKDRTDKNSILDVYINGTQVAANVPYYKNIIVSDATTVTDPVWYTRPGFTSTGVSGERLTPTYVSRSTYMKVGYNDVRIRVNPDFDGRVYIARMGVYHSGGAWRYTEPSDQKYRRPIELGSMGQNSYVNFSSIALGLNSSEKDEGYTHMEHRIDWYEPSDGTHAYIQTQDFDAPSYYNEENVVQFRARAAVRYKVRGSEKVKKYDNYGRDYYIMPILGGESFSGPESYPQKASNQSTYF